MRLKWKAIHGTCGQRRPITINTTLGEQEIPKAVCYGQWAIHENYLDPPKLKITHIPTGHLVCRRGMQMEAQLRDLIARLLVVPEFRNQGDRKSIRQTGQIVKTWAAELKGGK